MYISVVRLAPKKCLDFFEFPELGKRPIDTVFRNQDDGDQERAIECPQIDV